MNVSAAPATEPAMGIDARIFRQQVSALFSTIRAATYADSAVAMVFGALMYWELRNPLILAWMGLHFATVLRLPIFNSYFRNPEAALDNSAHWARLYCREVRINSCVWALAPLMYLPADSLPLTSLMMLVMMAICAVGSLSVAPLKQALLNYITPMMLGLSVALALHASAVSLFLSACSVAYLVMLLKFAMAQHRLLTESLHMRYEMDELAAKLQEQVRVTELASQEKTRFLAAASHDLRQPLHAIALFGAALEYELHERPERENAAQLMSAVNMLSNSLDTMLDVSRLDAGVIVPERQSLPVHALFQSLNQGFMGVASQRELQLRLRSSPLWVHSDLQLLRRMLSNLIDNALKYTRQGGVLVVARARGDAVHIEIYDTGIGIAPEQITRVFEEFYQIDNPGRDRSKGLGIGLAIVQRLSRLLDHPVEVSSSPGRGSRFRVRLPGSLPEAAATGSDMPKHLYDMSCLPRRVLVLDDEEVIRKVMSVLLSAQGIDVFAVANETQAAAVLAEAVAQSRPIDLLLCDFRLADGADGLDVIYRLRRCFASNLPALLITGETAPERLQRVRDSGVPVLFKPVSANRLFQAMAATIRQAGRW